MSVLLNWQSKDLWIMQISRGIIWTLSVCSISQVHFHISWHNMWKLWTHKIIHGYQNKFFSILFIEFILAMLLCLCVSVCLLGCNGYVTLAACWKHWKGIRSATTEHRSRIYPPGRHWYSFYSYKYWFQTHSCVIPFNLSTRAPLHEKICRHHD